MHYLAAGSSRPDLFSVTIVLTKSCQVIDIKSRVVRYLAGISLGSTLMPSRS